MLLLINLLQAAKPAASAAQGQPQGSQWSFWIMILAIFAIMYFFMIRPQKNRQKKIEEFRRGLKSAGGWLRRELGEVLNLRYTPELVFELDHSIEYGAHISELINSLEIRQDGEEGHEL